MQCHACDLRAEVENDWTDLTGSPKPAPNQLDTFVHQAVDDWRRLPLRQAVWALAEHAEKLTRRPDDCERGDIDALRAIGWSDKEIHDAVQVAAYFNYINRVADGLGVTDEPGLPRWGTGEDSP